MEKSIRKMPLLLVIALLVLISSVTSAQSSSCATGTAVTDPDNNPGLVDDCDVLLAARDTLAGDTTLNWSADLAIGAWDGVTVGGTPLRVRGLNLQEIQLTGTIPSELGNLSNLTSLYLSYNQLTGGIPASLGNLNDLSALNLTSNPLTGRYRWNWAA